MKKNIIKFCKIIVFLLIFILLLSILTKLFVRKGNGYGTDVFDFYKQPKNSIDILYLGSSHAYSSFNPYLIEKQTGLKGYDFATQQQPIWITYHYLKEALKYQKPQYVVLETHMVIVQENDYAEEQVNRDAIDKMRLSKNKLDVIDSSVQDDKLSYYFNIIKYHTRYKELNKIDFKTVFLNYSIDNKGYIALPEKDYKFEKQYFEISGIEMISKKNEEYLNKIIKLCNKKNIELIFAKTPAKYNEVEYKKLKYVECFSKKNDILFLNYIDNIDSLNLDYQKDFYDDGHLNKLGSKKLSIEFSKKINELTEEEND